MTLAPRVCPISSRTRAGFTLLEMLAVVAILGVVAATLAPSLAGTSKRGTGYAARAALLELDAQARIHSRRQGPVELVAGESNVTLKDLRTGREVKTLELEPGVHVNIEIEADSPRLVFDSRGCSPDYRIHLKFGGLDEESWRVLGLTGWAVKEDED